MKILYVDFDGTLVTSNSFQYVQAVLLENFRQNKGIINAFRLGFFYFCLPLLILADACHAALRDRLTYVFYFGIRKDLMKNSLCKYFQKSESSLIQETFAYIKQQKALGYKIVIVSGSIREAIEAATAAFAMDVDKIICAELKFQNDICRGRLLGEPMVNQQKSIAARIYEKGRTIKHCIAISDSMGDLPLLELAQHKIVVNPSSRLRRMAVQHGWEIWNTHSHSRDVFVLFHGSFRERVLLARFLWNKRTSIRQFAKDAIFARKNTLVYWQTSWKRFPIQRFADQMVACSTPAFRSMQLHVFNADNPGNEMINLPMSELVQSDHMSTFLTIREKFQAHFHQEKYLGRWQDPDGLHFTLNKSVIIEQLRHVPEVKTAMDSLRRDKSASSVEKIFQQYCVELMPGRSYTFIRMVRRLVKAIFERLYVEVRVEGLERLRKVDRHYQIVYLPTHRSHFDFLIAPLRLYFDGIHSPYIAASNHLNKFPARYLQKVSAFFIRRKKMDSLYNSIMFSLFRIHQQYGFSQQVFIEGTRSKVGVTLAPKVGIISQYIDAFIAESKRPVAFVPVHLSYDYVVEGDSFFEEIVSYKKSNGTLHAREEKGFDAYRVNRKKLSKIQKIKLFFYDLKQFSRKGRAYISYGQPLYLQDYIDRSPEQPADIHDHREDGIPHAWVRQIAKDVAADICVELNKNAPITLTSVVSTAIIASQQFALSTDRVEHFIELTKAIFQVFGLETQHINQPPKSGDYTYVNRDRRRANAALNKVECRRLTSSVTTHYYFSSELDRLRANLIKNNIMHHFIIPSIVSSCINRYGSIDFDQLDEYLATRYEGLRVEFHLPWTLNEARKMARKVVEVFEEKNLLIRIENGKDVSFRSVSTQESCPFALFAGAVEFDNRAV